MGPPKWLDQNGQNDTKSSGRTRSCSVPIQPPKIETAPKKLNQHKFIIMELPKIIKLA